MIVFFDIDETLLDQRKAERYAAARFLEAFADRIPSCPTAEEFCARWRRLREKHRLSGVLSSEDQRHLRMRDLFSESEPHLTETEIGERLAIYQQHYRQGWTLFDDVRPTLDSLAEVPLGIISNGSHEQQVDKLRHTGILDRFEVIVISEAVGAAKPDGAIFHHACDLARCAPGDGVHVGDRMDLDAWAGCRAGLRGIWLDRARIGHPAAVERICALTELQPLLV
jgi:putative hydrolase of the HAD superfamily